MQKEERLSMVHFSVWDEKSQKWSRALFVLPIGKLLKPTDSQINLEQKQ